MLNLSTPERTIKPRKTGITHVLDKGLGLNAIKDLIETSGQYIDILKFGWGTSFVTPNLIEKIELYRKAGIRVCFGGTLFECAFLNNQVDNYEAWLKDLGLDLIEISDGTILLSLPEKLKLIERFSRNFDVLSEVGSKDADVVVAPNAWIMEIKSSLEAGVLKVITEGRESGTTGFFNQSGDIKSGLIDEILQDISHENLIFEAPKKPQQIWFIRHFGANVNLGNISEQEVISVETLRQGLRSDTLMDFHGKGCK